jgi:hypothetical protein
MDAMHCDSGVQANLRRGAAGQAEVVLSAAGSNAVLHLVRQIREAWFSRALAECMPEQGE